MLYGIKAGNAILCPVFTVNDVFTLLEAKYAQMSICQKNGDVPFLQLAIHIRKIKTVDNTKKKYKKIYINLQKSNHRINKNWDWNMFN